MLLPQSEQRLLAELRQSAENGTKFLGIMEAATLTSDGFRIFYCSTSNL